ncbi:hypothetical protein QUC31_006122 [Theobroma cacao]
MSGRKPDSTMVEGGHNLMQIPKITAQQLSLQIANKIDLDEAKSVSNHQTQTRVQIAMAADPIKEYYIFS